MAARDPIDELMTSALEFERNEVAVARPLPTPGSRAAMSRSSAIRPQRANAVRVMTVHGAKGLEAPLVILADATADPANLGGRNPPLDLPVGGEKVPVIRPTKAELMPPFDRDHRRRAGARPQEHWRLLYVGMTRASERLVVGGDRAEPRRSRKQLAQAGRAGAVRRSAQCRSR